MSRSRGIQVCLVVLAIVVTFVLSSCGSSSPPSASTLVEQGVLQLAVNPQGHYKLSLLAQATVPSQGGVVIEGGTIQRGAGKEKTLSVSGEVTGAYRSGEFTASGSVTLLGRSISGRVAVKGKAVYVEYGGKWYATTSRSASGAEASEIEKLKAELQGELGNLKNLEIEKFATSTVSSGSNDTWVVTLHPNAGALSSLLKNNTKSSSEEETEEDNGEEKTGTTPSPGAAQLGQLGKMLGGVLSQVASNVTVTMTFHQGSDELEGIHVSWQQPSLNFLVQIRNINVQVNVQVLDHNAPTPFTPPASYLPLQELEKVTSETTSSAGLSSL